MKAEDYLDSGLLELYVYGVLPEDEHLAVAKVVNRNPDLQSEVVAIETVLMELSGLVSPGLNQGLKQKVLQNIDKKSNKKVKIVTSNYSYFGWAAAILLLGGVLWLLKLNQDLQTEIQVVESELNDKKVEVVSTEQNLNYLQDILENIKSPEFRKVTLPGNEINAPNTRAVAFYSDENNELILDVTELPEPPKGMVYQVWSLKMEPLTPTSVGLLAESPSSENKIFKLQDIPDTEGFGITLEPEGGSKTPNLDQLYALGTI
ncbi:anti-sigma factor [Psychroflexus aestuariivivens]|uniref:anti-sigma factor n=1 Tax=Psychroflexus aestuariivivens TaxID=1795040 RepID=UPI000FD91A93|nr:anti-sigma factor [Psychroflexus aestuariivivens]